MNLNDRVRIKLRGQGHTILECMAKTYGYPYIKEEYKDLQLWEVMQIFGPHLSMSHNPPIETEMELL